MPSRESSLIDAVNCLLNQSTNVDEICIYLNDFPAGWTAPWGDPRVRCLHSDSAMGDLADSGKFYWADESPGYYLTVDDDIAYPHNYVEKVIEGIERYSRRAVVSFHGAITTSPISKYYKRRIRTFHCTHGLASDQLVNVGGTGVMGFHQDAVDVHIDMFEKPYMADIWMGVICQHQEVPQVVLAHDEDFINLLDHDLSATIHAQFVGNDWVQAQVVNSVDTWKIFDPTR